MYSVTDEIINHVRAFLALIYKDKAKNMKTGLKQFTLISLVFWISSTSFLKNVKAVDMLSGLSSSSYIKQDLCNGLKCKYILPFPCLILEHEVENKSVSNYSTIKTLKENTKSNAIHSIEILEDDKFKNGSNIFIQGINDFQMTSLMKLCKVWGFLKYYHPKISSGKYNWDYELFKIMPQINNCKNEHEVNAVIHDWIISFGIIKASGGNKKIDSSRVKMYPNLSWISNDTLFDGSVIKLLKQIEGAKRNTEGYYAKVYPLGNPNFTNENGYTNITYKDAGFRLLTLFRYWNIIQYFYPYRYLFQTEWERTLEEFIPKFVNVKDETGYKLIIQELIARINDTHANIWNDETIYNWLGLNYSLLKVGFIEDDLVVVGYFNDELGRKTGIEKGDIIIRVNNKKVSDIVKEKLPYTPASNYKTQLRLIGASLLRSTRKKIKIEYQRNGKNYTDSVECQNPKYDKIFSKSLLKDTCWKFITKEIGYIYPGTIKNKYLPMIMSEFKNTKGIIIDLRCYPSEFIVFSLGEYLMSKPTDFAKISKCEIAVPGLFTFTDNVKIGKVNPEYYKGKVVIIVDESTLSQAEYTAMAFRVALNAVVVGSTTAAADGDVSAFFLPGGIRTLITGVGVYYPDGRETQRIGIVPDIFIEPTIKGIKEGRDEYLEKAIEVINKSQSRN